MTDRKQEFTELYRQAVTAAQAGQEAEAQLGFAKAAAFAPEQWCDIATKLAKEGEEDMALEHWRMALQVTDHAQIRSGIFNNIAILYAKRGQLKEAFELLDQALKCDPQSADAYTNLGQVHKWNGNLRLADRYCLHALARNPWHNEAQFLQALNALDRGDYLNGFRLYECRWRSKTNGFRRVECDKPEWHGEAANG